MPVTAWPTSLSLSQQVGTVTVGNVVIVTATGTVTVANTEAAGYISFLPGLTSWNGGRKNALILTSSSTASVSNTNTPAPSSNTNSGGGGLSPGAKAGIAVGAVVGFLFSFGVGLWYGRRLLAQRKKKDETPEVGGGKAEVDGKTELDAVQAMVVEKDADLEVGGGRPELETVEKKEMDGSETSPSTTGGGEGEKAKSEVVRYELP
ncbi:hypothetical protein BUE80_DR004590 [Diplocarpon rosae]|nr:hypothetical protein BUE80_DR004590 [Diplocarpon rosae]